ncbi:uncharacterized protein [Littorina saxatilis]|uniref:C2H2-type domain-containing protein n=1 Tax=Littorina saxatilis TaxID=31220 RepID=A0AAN9BZL0_9CAEN
MNPTGNASPCNGIGPTIAVVGINGWRCFICNTTFERSFSIEHHMIINHHPLPQELTVPITNTNATVACSDAASLGHSHLSTGTIHSDSAVNNLQDLILSKSDQTGRIEESVSQGQKEVNMDVSGAPTKVCESLQRTNPVSETAEDNSSQGTILGSSRPSTASSETRETLADITIRALPDDVSMQQDRPVIVKKEPGVNILESDTMQPQGAGKSQTGGTQATGERSVNENLRVYFTAPQHAACTGSIYYQGAKNQNSPTSPQAKIPKMYPTSGDTETTFVHCKPNKRRVCSCGEAFDTKHEFRHHRRVVHCKLNQKFFICPICNAQYQYKRGLNRHIAMKGQVAVACTECPQRFHDQASLESHRAACHGTDSPVGQNNQPLVAKEERLNIQDVPRQGPYCRRGNNSHAGLMLPWECSKCKKHFPERPAFRKHLIECGILKFPDKHRTFECNLCGAAFQWLVPYYKHYINVHKTASLIQPTNSPAHFESFYSLENSPANSPCPSMTSEINSALADVDLNTHGASNASGSCISSASTTDSSSKQISNVGMGELSIDDSWSLRSSNPQSLSSDAGSSDWTRDSDIIILSDPEGSVTVDSSSSDDSDEDWEVISGNSGKISDGAKPAPSEPVFPGVHIGGVFSSGAHHFPRPGFAPMRPPPPHPRHCLPPPPPHPPFPHFPPPPRHHHDHHHGPHHGHHHGGPFHGAGWGRFPHGRGMHGPWSMWGHGAFGGRGCFFEEHDEYDEETLGKKQSNASETSKKTAGTGSDPSEAHPPSSASRKEGEPSVPSEASSDGTSSSCPVPGAEFFPWTGKTKEGKCAKKMIKQLFRSIIASYQQGRTFLFCPDCMQAFSEESDLDAHCKVTHSATSQYLCFLCQQGIKSPLEYNRHIRQHCQEFTQMRGRGCGRGRGGWMMGQKGGFRHLFKKLVKEGPSAFLPNMSPFAHGPHSVDSNQDLDDSESNPEHFNECPICFKKFRANSRENFFERHVNSHFGVETFNFKCEIDNCGKTFLEKAKFTAHQATHSAPQAFTCDDCGKSYLNKTSLTRHQRIHNGERPYKCSECGEGFIENRDLVRHRAVHTGESPFKCEECGTGFTLKASLLTHKRNKHQGLGPFTCTGCAQVFPSASALTRHHAVCSKSEGGDTKVEEGETESHQVKQEPADMDLD